MDRGVTADRRLMLRAVAGVSVLAFVLVACGQKPGVHIAGAERAPQGQARQPGQTTPTDTSTTTDDGTQTGDQTGDQTVAAPGDSSQTTGPGTTQQPSGTQTTAPSGQQTQGPSGGPAQGGTDGTAPDQGGAQQPATTSGQRQPQGSDRTGVTDTTITLATHAPVTGAAPLPTTSFEKSSDLYWRWMAAQGVKPLGRDVELIFRDDKYDPNSARQVCRELEAKAFTISGGGGTDQIQACGQFAGVAQFPYFSAGVTEAGLRGNPWYYAISMSYKQQGLLLAQMVKKTFPNAKVAAIITDTPNFDDAVEGWEQGVAQQGLDYAETLRHPKGDTSWYNAYAAELAGEGVNVIYTLTSPVDYIRFAQQASQQGADFQYVGVGISMGLNAVLGSGCPQVDGGMFFSPFPGLDWARQSVPEFFQAGERFNAPTDDIALALWAANKTFHEFAKAYESAFGTDLVREDFRALMETLQGVESGIFPTLNYSPQDHFGADQVHLLKANCAIEEYETMATFASAF